MFVLLNFRLNCLGDGEAFCPHKTKTFAQLCLAKSTHLIFSLFKSTTICLLLKNQIYKSEKLIITMFFFAELNQLQGEIESGKMTCILGSSGAGKSTFMNFISGRLSLNAYDIAGDLFAYGSKVDPREFRDHIAYVEQVTFQMSFVLLS